MLHFLGDKVKKIWLALKFMDSKIGPDSLLNMGADLSFVRSRGEPLGWIKMMAVVFVTISLCSVEHISMLQ